MAEETTNSVAKTRGQYHCKWWFKKPNDAEKHKTRLCTFWPVIKELSTSGWYGATVPCSPAKAHKLLEKERYRWYQKEVNIAEDAIYGPFNFEPRYRIPDAAWQKLKDMANEANVDISTVDRVQPHARAKRSRVS